MQTTSGLTQPTKLASALNRRDGIRVVDGATAGGDGRGRATARTPSVQCSSADPGALGPDALRATIIAFRDALRAHAPTINRLNVYPVPDGDTGTNMALTLESVVAESLRRGRAPTWPRRAQAISHGSLMGARGNSGVILSQILRGPGRR